MMKKRIISAICAVALAVGLVPVTNAFAADPITTDLVIHKMKVDSGTSLDTHNGEEITDFTGTNLDGATTMQGVKFKYWTISSTATAAQMAAIQGLTTIEEIEAYASANPTVLTGGTETAATNASGIVNVNGLAEGKYIFGELNGAANNVTEYLGVPFLLELPAMKSSGTAYFGTGANALHVYPKNVLQHPGLDIKTVDESNAQIGGAKFLVQQYNSATSAYETVTSIGTNGEISLPTGFITLADLPAGHYQLVNTLAPPGYMSDDRPVKFDVAGGVVTFDATSSPLASFTAPATPADNPLITIKFLKKPDVTKTESSGGTERIGETVTWTVSLDVPTAIEDYQIFSMTDTIDSRLDFLGLTSITVKVDGADLISGTHYTATYVGNKMTVAFVPTTLSTYVGKKIIVTYGTKINETAVMGQEIPNDVELSFDNGHGAVAIPGDPVNPPIKPPTPPTVWTGGAKFKKVDGNNTAVALPDAEFKIASDAAGTTFLTWTQDLIDANDVSKFVTPLPGADITMKSGADGTFEIKGLKGGTYYLVETKAPSVGGTQYNLLRDPAAFVITQTSYETSETMSVENRSGLEIPKTGGIGTVIFTIVGIALMGVAAMMFRRKKEASKSEE